MPYTPQTWSDNNATYPLSAARMTVMETGIQSATQLGEQGHRILTTGQRDALTGVATGTMIYNSTTAQIEAYLGGAWVKVPTADDEAYGYVYHNTAITFAATAHTKIPWSTITSNKNVSLSSGSIVFAKTGVYEFTVGMRFGTGGDIWTGVNLFNASTSTMLAQSYGTGSVPNDPGPVSWQFLANVTSTSNLHDIRIYRAAGTLVTSVPDVNAGWAYTCTIKRLNS
jgi:hypothetical protein